jgi:hypothetical protein
MADVLKVITKHASSGAKSVNPIAALENITKHVTEWQNIKQQEKTKRLEISAKRDILIENIHAERDAFLEVLRLNYEERSKIYEELFSRLDQSLESGNIEIAQLAMSGIVEQIKANPLPSFGDFRKSIQGGPALDF